MKLKIVWRIALTVLPLAFASNCKFVHREILTTENPKSAFVQGDSMMEMQKTEKRTLSEGAVPVKADTLKVFDKETEEKINAYVGKLIKDGWVLLPKEDAWMAKEIALRADYGPGRGWVVSIGDPDPFGRVFLEIVARIRGVE